MLSTPTRSQPPLVSLDLRTVRGDSVNEEIFRAPPSLRLGSFSNDDADGNEDLKKAIGMMSNTTTLHVHHAFFVQFVAVTARRLRRENARSQVIWRGCKQGMTNFYFLFLTQVINSREIRLHSTFSANWNKRGKL